MTAYNKSWLYNLFVRNETDAAFDDGLLSREEKDNIDTAYTVPFYTPDLFIRIGLFILTNVILSFSFGFLSLFFMGVMEKAVGFMLIFFAAITYAALEFMLHRKRHYHSGVDDALMLGAATLVFSGLSFSVPLGSVGYCLLLLIVSLFFAFRFANRLMAIISFLAFLGLAFFISTKSGVMGKVLMPFIIMIISLLIYIFANKLAKPKTFSVYTGCFQAVEILSLITLYVSGNYWIVRELSNSMFDLRLQSGQTIPYGWLFWIFTIIIPAIYLIAGIKMKDAILLRTGLLLVAAIVFTVRYYHSVLPVEVAMVTGGAVLVLVAYILTRYLRVSRSGFTSEKLNSSGHRGSMQIESLILAQSFSQDAQTQEGTQFGGGSFGGGGASSGF